MPGLYDKSLSPLLELAKAVLPKRRPVTAEDMTQLLDPTTGSQRRVNVGGVNMTVHPEEWRLLQGDTLTRDLREWSKENSLPSRDEMVQYLSSPESAGRRPAVNALEWSSRGKGHESFTLPGPRANYRVRGMEGADGLTDSGDYQYHFADSPVHARLSQRTGNGIGRTAGVLDDITGESDEPFDYISALAGGLSRIRAPGWTTFEGNMAALPERDAEDLYRLARQVINHPDSNRDLVSGLQAGLPRIVQGAPGLRSTHIDELQSDFYSMPTVPVGQRARLTEIEQELARRPLHRGMSLEDYNYRLALVRERASIPNYDIGRPPGPFEKLWPRLAFNQVAREALEGGDDLVTWSPPWVHDRLYRRKEPGIVDFAKNPGTAVRHGDTPYALNEHGDRFFGGMTFEDFIKNYRGPQIKQLQDFLRDSTLREMPIDQGVYWTSPDSLMYHNMYGPNGTVEDAAKRFLRAYGEDPKSGLTTTRLEGAGWTDRDPSGREIVFPDRHQSPAELGADVPGMRISPNMRDIYKRLRDENEGRGVPLYAEGGHVQAEDKPVTLEDFVLQFT